MTPLNLSDMEVLDLIKKQKKGRITEQESRVLWEHLTKLAFVYAFASLRGGARQQNAEDISQDALIRMLKAIRNCSFDVERGAYRGYLKKIVENLIKDRIEEEENSQTVPIDKEALDKPDKGPGPDVLVEIDETLKIVKECMAGLTERERTILYYDQKGWSAEEIAGKLETSKESVYTGKSQALKKLKECVEKRLEGDLLEPATLRRVFRKIFGKK